MKRPGILTLTTDFGTDGPYVAAMKGVVLGLAPDARLVDVSHAVGPQNVAEGAFLLAEVVGAFPTGTIHLAVVDPGVGTDRRLIAARAADQWFVLPDNGLISGVAGKYTPTEVWEITSPSIRRATVSETFHGRDILAPAAAHLLVGGDPSDLGPRLSRYVMLGNSAPVETADGCRGRVIFRDAFGNLITNVFAEQLSGRPADAWLVEIAGARIDGLTRTYGDQIAGDLIALIGGTGRLEVAVVNGSAAGRLSATTGATVRVRKKMTATPISE